MLLPGIISQQPSSSGGGGSFPPAVVSVTPTEITSGTSHDISLGSTVSSGDLLIIVAASDGGSSDEPSTSATGWSKIRSFSSSAAGAAVFVKIATGSEGGTTINITTPSTEAVTAQCYRINTWSGSLSDVVSATAVVGVTHEATFPTLTSGFGSVPTLWIAPMASSRSSTITTYPSNYTVTSNGTVGTANAQINCGYRQLTAASETPQSYTWSVSNDWSTTTIAVRGT